MIGAAVATATLAAVAPGPPPAPAIEHRPAPARIRDTSCTSPLQDERIDFTIAGSTAIAAPSPVLLLRQPNVDSPTRYDLPVTPVAGADQYEVRFALGGVTGADGAFTGPSQTAPVISATGRAAVSFPSPGRYTFIARASTYSQAFTPWSRPLSVTVRAPFDVLAYTLRFTDDTGPSFRLEGQVREPAPAGRSSSPPPAGSTAPTAPSDTRVSRRRPPSPSGSGCDRVPTA